LAKEAVVQYQRGETESARKTYETIESVSQEVANLLDGVKRECGK